MISMTETYKQSKYHSDTIISDITKTLDSNNVKYESLNRHEVIVNGGDYSKDTIHYLLSSNMSETPEDIFNVLIDITEVSGVVYIRQKTK